MDGIKNRFRPQELWWQHFKKSEVVARRGDIIFDSDRLLIPVRQYFRLLDIAAFDEYAFIAYSFLKAQSEMFMPKYKVVPSINRITSGFKIFLIYDRDTFGGVDCPLHFEAFKDNGNFIESEALLSQINARFHLSSSYITDENKRDNWIEQYCRYIMYTTVCSVNEENNIVDGKSFIYKKTYRSAYPFQVRKFAADWMRDIHEFTDKDYNEYFNLECPAAKNEIMYLVGKIEKQREFDVEYTVAADNG